MPVRKTINGLLADGVKGIALSPISPLTQVEAIGDLAEQATVVCVDSDVPTSGRVAFVGTDQIAAGRMAGKLLKEALPDGGKVMVFVGVKTLLVSLGTYLLWRFRKRAMAVVAIFVCFLAYYFLLLYHLRAMNLRLFDRLMAWMGW